MNSVEKDSSGSVGARCLGFFTGLITLVALMGIGLLVCCLPITTSLLAQATVDDALSPYSHEQLVQSATDIRNLTIDGITATNQDGLSNEEILYQTTGDYAMSLPNDTLKRYGADPLVVRSFSNNEEVGRYVGSVNTALGLDADALRHLHDVNVVTSKALPIFFCSLVLCLVLLGLLFKFSKPALKWVLRLTPLILIIIFVSLGAWGMIDFYGLFSVFHGILFPQGNWTFAINSLLICSLPTGFWMGMAGIWLVCTLAACIICFILSWSNALKVH